MANNCECVFVFSHKKKRVIKKIAKAYDRLLEYLDPMPKGVDEYFWKTSEWGVKHDVSWARVTYKPFKLPTGRWEVEITGETPWGPPSGALAYARKRWPKLIVECAFYEPGLAFVGMDDAGGEESWQLEEYDLSKISEVDRLCNNLPGKLVDRLGLHARLYGDIAMMDGYSRAIGEL